MRFLDALDGALAQALASHGSQREAKAFARSVQLNHTYYSVVTCRFPWGEERLLMEWVFTRRAPFTGDPMCDTVSANSAWLGYGPLHATRPGRLQTLAEYRNGPEFPPDPARALQADLRPARV